MSRSRDAAGFPPTLKRLGQHFLADPVALERIVDALAPTAGDTVVEIGPGRGALTELLLPRVGRLVAVELDRALAGLLEQRYADDPRVAVVERDILKTPLGEIAGDRYLLVGNVPYYITTPILFHTLAGVLPTRAVFLVQREVAERAMAPAGSKTYGALSVNLQVLTEIERMFEIPPGAFRPPPKVDSTVILLRPREVPLISRPEQRAFQQFVQALFGQRRKQLGTILRSLAAGTRSDTAAGRESRPAANRDAVFAALGIDPSDRPERLTPPQFVALFRATRQREG